MMYFPPLVGVQGGYVVRSEKQGLLPAGDS